MGSNANHRWTSRSLLLSTILLSSCGPVMEEHQVTIESDCLGAVRWAQYRFEATDFERNCSSVDGQWSSCDGGYERGQFVDGDPLVEMLVVEGTESFGRSRYRALLDTPEPLLVDHPYARHIECIFHHNDERPEQSQLAQPQRCYYSKRACDAVLRVVEPSP